MVYGKCDGVVVVVVYYNDVLIRGNLRNGIFSHVMSAEKSKADWRITFFTAKVSFIPNQFACFLHWFSTTVAVAFDS